MKIAVFHNLPAGGAKRTLFEELKYLSRNHKIYLFLLSSTSDRVFPVEPLAEKVYRFNFDSSFSSFGGRLAADFRVFFKLPRVERQMAEFINKGGFDLALVHQDELTQAPYLLRYLKIPTVYFCQDYLRQVYEPALHSIEVKNPLKRSYENLIRCYRKRVDFKNITAAKNVLANSAFTAASLEKFYGLKAEVCHLGVDETVFKPIGRKKGDFLLFIGGKSIAKGFDLARQLEKEISKWGLKIKYLYFGENEIADDFSMAREYSRALATLYPARNEPFGIAAIESMACETPVLAVNEGGFKETMVDGRTGFLLPPKKEAFAKKIKLLSENRDLVRKMGKFSRKYVVERFLWKSHCEKVEHKIYSVLADSRKILISGQDSGGLGGAESFSISLGEGLARRGWNVSYTAVTGSDFDRLLKQRGIKAENIPLRMDIVGNWRGFLKFFFFLPFILPGEVKILKKFASSGTGTVILPGFSDKIILTLPARILNLKVIWLEFGPLGPLAGRLFSLPIKVYRFFSGFADKIIVPSLNTRRLIKGFLKEKSKIKLIPLGITVLPMAEVKKYYSAAVILRKKLRLENKFVIGMVSRLEKGKGQALLLKAVAILKEKIPDLTVLIVGQGEVEDLKTLAKKLEIIDKVKFLGFWPDVYEIMAVFDIFVFPSTWKMEGFGLVVLEAANLSKPVVATDFGPIPEVLGKDGILVTPDKEKLAAAIYNLYNDSLLRKRVGQRLRRRLEKKFDLNFCLDSFEKEIKNLNK